MNHKREELENGLTLLGEVNPYSKSVALGFFVNTGARDETSDESGISHFLEHMMFKGTAKRSALDVTFDLGAIGAQANAYTSEETTVYYAAVLPENFSGLFELLSDMLQPSIVQEEFDTEKNVILEEIALYEDRPHYYLFEQSLMAHFSGHNAGNSVLGSTKSVSAISSEQMRSYFTRRYNTANMVVVASGNFEWDEYRDLARKYCATWKAGEAGRKTLPFVPEQKKQRFFKKDLSQEHILLMGNGVGAASPYRYALNVLSTIIGDGTGSRYYWDLVDIGLAESAGMEFDGKDDLGVSYAYASTAPENREKVLDIMYQILSTPLEFSEADLERAKNKICSRIVLGGELPMGRLMSLGNEWIYRKGMHSLDNEVSGYRAIKMSDIEAALDAYPLENWSEFSLSPEK